MFAPNVTCVVVLNHVLRPELWPFKHLRDFLLGISFSAKDENTPPLLFSFSECKQSQALLKSGPSRTQIIHASFGSPAMLLKLIYSPAHSAQITPLGLWECFKERQWLSLLLVVYLSLVFRRGRILLFSLCRPNAA